MFRERLNILEANGLYNWNTDPNLIVEVDATKLSVTLTGGKYNEASVIGFGGWLVHGAVTLKVDSSGNVIEINPEKYDFNWDSGRSFKRSLLTFVGAMLAIGMRPSVTSVIGTVESEACVCIVRGLEYGYADVEGCIKFMIKKVDSVIFFFKPNFSGNMELVFMRGVGF